MTKTVQEEDQQRAQLQEDPQLVQLRANLCSPVHPAVVLLRHHPTTPLLQGCVGAGLQELVEPLAGWG